MHLKSIFQKVFESMFLAWIWAFLFLLDYIFLSDVEPQNIFLKFFDRLVLFSCFLIYPFALPFYSTKAIWPFFMQFVFWWVFGFAMLKLYQRLSR